MGDQRENEAARERRTGKGFVSGRGKERLGVVGVVAFGGRCVIDGRCCLFCCRQCGWGAYGCENECTETAEAALPPHIAQYRMLSEQRYGTYMPCFGSAPELLSSCFSITKSNRLPTDFN